MADKNKEKAKGNGKGKLDCTKLDGEEKEKCLVMQAKEKNGAAKQKGKPAKKE